MADNLRMHTLVRIIILHTIIQSVICNDDSLYDSPKKEKGCRPKIDRSVVEKVIDKIESYTQKLEMARIYKLEENQFYPKKSDGPVELYQVEGWEDYEEKLKHCTEIKNGRPYRPPSVDEAVDLLLFMKKKEIAPLKVVFEAKTVYNKIVYLSSMFYVQGTNEDTHVLMERKELTDGSNKLKAKFNAINKETVIDETYFPCEIGLQNRPQMRKINDKIDKLRLENEQLEIVSKKYFENFEKDALNCQNMGLQPNELLNYRVEIGRYISPDRVGQILTEMDTMYTNLERLVESIRKLNLDELRIVKVAKDSWEYLRNIELRRLPVWVIISYILIPIIILALIILTYFCVKGIIRACTRGDGQGEPIPLHYVS